MEALTPALLIAGALNIVAFPLLFWFIKRLLEKFDGKREKARIEQSEAEIKAIEQREAERGIVLAIARTMLLDNYEKCMEKGYYTVEEREVYAKLYENYSDDGGNGIIEEIAPRIRALPMEPPKDKEVRND